MLLADFLSITDEATGRVLIRAMPLMLGVLCVLAIAYRYYSAFLAARVATLNDARLTPAHQFNDGQNYHPTNKWVLFGHHFAAISGAGPLIGPVLAMQYGYAPGLLWLIIGVCLAGAVQDMLVMAVSVRTGGKSLAEIAKREIGPKTSILVTIAILLIVIVALAGLAIIVVKALGGEEGKLPAGMTITVPANARLQVEAKPSSQVVTFPKECTVQYSPKEDPTTRSESFLLRFPSDVEINPDAKVVVLPAKCAQVIPGSSWGTFTIACTIPIALFVGLWMYRIRPGRIVEASVIGGIMTLGAVVAGAWIPHSALEPYFALSRETSIIALCTYGFIAAVLPVWLLLTPRDYLSSFMKIGTLGILILGVIIANPILQHPPINQVFRNGGPTFEAGGIFPFVFICVMCGAISGFHSLVASGTTPKMVGKESDIRMIGYGAMLMEGLVGIVALIAAASLSPTLYFEINVDVERAPDFAARIVQLDKQLRGDNPLHKVGVNELHQLNLAQLEESVGGESLRGRTGGAVTLAVSMAMILTDAFSFADMQVERLMKYWYHFAIMFEALFILTTIDAGTRIARYLFQEAMGRVAPNLGKTNSIAGGIVATLLVTLGWGSLVWTGQISTIWPMFGISNQLLAVLALSLVTTYLVNHGQGKFAPVTILPMLFVSVTTLSAGKLMMQAQLRNIDAGVNTAINTINFGLILLVVTLVATIVLIAVSRWVSVLMLGPKNASKYIPDSD